MSKIQIMRGFISQRLSAAAEEIFELFERTIAEYEEQLCRSKEENQRQQKLLEAVYNPEDDDGHKEGFQQVSVSEGDVPPEQQERSHSLDQENPPEPPYIKEEKEELWTQEGLGGPEESDIIQFTLSPVPVKSEDDEGEKAPSSEDDGAAQHQIQDQTQTEDKVYPCTLCGKKYPKEKSLKNHLKRHSEEKRFSCSVCNKTFPWRGELVIHMRTHTREKPFSCSICGTSFAHSSSLAVHLKRHSGEKPFSCPVCGKRFARKKQQTQHMRTHTGEKPFNCTVCGKTFAEKANLIRHSTVHTGEKMFCCSVCGKRFAHGITLKRHSTVHTGEKPFSCEICDKRFTRLQHVKKHKCVVVESSSNG